MIINESRTPFYLQVQEYFKQLIESEQLKPHDKIATEKSLMEQFDVSRITVANALAGLANEGWIYRIPGRGSFVADRQTKETSFQTVATGETGYNTRGAAMKRGKEIIGLILPGIVDLFIVRLIQGVNEIISRSEYNLYIYVSNNSKEQEKSAIRQLIRMGAVGLLIFPVDAETYNEEILVLKVRGFPFVLLDRYLPGVETDFIGSDNKVGAELAVAHLWELGHRNIAICSNAMLPTVTVDERITGYQREIKRRGGVINPDMMLTELHPADEMASQVLIPFLQAGKATAFITLQGGVCLLLLRIAESLKLQIPRDISIVAFDNLSPDYDNFSFLTHISQSEQQIGIQGASLLLKLLTNKGPDGNAGYERKIIQPKLVVRNSSGVRLP